MNAITKEEGHEIKGYPVVETIECPCCGNYETAKVHFYEGDPLETFMHTCSDCGWEIGESEWNKVEEDHD